MPFLETPVSSHGAPPRNRVSRTCVPKQSLGTRNKFENEVEGCCRRPDKAYYLDLLLSRKTPSSSLSGLPILAFRRGDTSIPRIVSLLYRAGMVSSPLAFFFDTWTR